MFDADDFPPGSLSLVTCFQTIEHLGDPLKFCKDVARLLRPGGALLLVGHNRRHCRPACWAGGRRFSISNTCNYFLRAV